MAQRDYYLIGGGLLAVLWTALAVWIFLQHLKAWREYPLQSSLRGAITGFLILCTNFVLPVMNLQLPFTIDVYAGMVVGPGSVAFSPPSDEILLKALALTGALAAWFAYLNYKYAKSAKAHSDKMQSLSTERAP